MSVRRRITKTVTEDFDDAAITPLSASGPATGTAAAALQQLKSTKTPMHADEEEDGATPIPQESDPTAPGNHQRFAADLKSWIGQHSYGIFGTLFLVAGALVSFVWVAAEKQTRTTTVVENMERIVRDLAEQTRAISERLVRVEVRANEPSRNAPAKLSPREAPRSP